MEMTWPYVAGFFDGEGCLHAVGGGFKSGSKCKDRFRVTIAQSNPIGKTTLEEIADFLKEHGINGYVLKHHNKKEQLLHPGKRRPMWNLWITQRQSVAWFIEGVFPYLRIKKQRAEDYRRLVIAFPPLRGELVEAKIPRPEFIQLVESGMKLTEIAAKFGINHAGVVARARRLGLHVNTVAESNRLRAKASTEDLQEAYAELGNYRLVAERFNMSSGSVWERLNGIVGPTKQKLAKVSTAELIRLLREGKGVKEIAREHGVINPATLYTRAKKAGFVFHRDKTPPSFGNVVGEV